MKPHEILGQLTEGTVLEGPNWPEPVKVLMGKARGTSIEVQAVGLNTKRLWNKLLKVEDFDGSGRRSGPEARFAKGSILATYRKRHEITRQQGR